MEKIIRDCLKTAVVGNSKSLRRKGLRAYAEKPKPKGWSSPQRNSTQRRPSPFFASHILPTAGFQVPVLPSPAATRAGDSTSLVLSVLQLGSGRVSTRLHLQEDDCLSPYTRGEQPGRRAARTQSSRDAEKPGSRARRGVATAGIGDLTLEGARGREERQQR